MINILWIVTLIIAVVFMIGAGIANAKTNKAFDSNIKELYKDKLELIEELEIQWGLRSK